MKISLGYIAGFVDGEGCITLSRAYRKDVRDDVWGNIQIALAYKEENVKLLTYFHKEFGGYYKKVQRRNINQNDAVFWRITSQKAAGLARQLLPYLNLKKRQAEIIIRYAKLRGKHSRKRSLRFSKKEINERKSLLREIRILNKRGFQNSLAETE